MTFFQTSNSRTIGSALRGPYALDASLIWITFPFTVLSVTWLNWANTGGEIWSWIFVGVLSHAAMTLTGLLLHSLFFANRESSLLKTMSAYSILGLVRGTAVAVFARLFDLESGPFPIFRPVGGMLVTVGILTVATWFVDGAKNYGALIRELSTTQDVLHSAETEINEVLKTERRRLLDLITTTIRGPIEAVQSLALEQSHGSNRDVVASINEIIDQRIKPLSRRLANEIRTWTPASHSPHSEHVPFTSLRMVDPTHPFLLGWIAFLLAPTIFSRHMSVPRAIALAMVCAATTALGSLLLRCLFRLSVRELSVLQGLAVGAGVSGVAFIPAGLILALEPALQPVQTAFISSGFTAITVSGAVIAGALANEQQRQQTEILLRAKNAELAQALARVSGQLWVQQSRIAEILHGQVQSSLIVTSARLMASESVSDAETITQLLKPIDSALNELEAPVTQPSFQHFLHELQEVWDGVLEIHDEVSTEALTVLDSFQDAAMICMSILREVVGNAFRSGGATRLSILVTTSDELLDLVVTNNGAPELPDSIPGLGTQLLRAATTNFSRGPEDGVQTLRASIPF